MTLKDLLNLDCRKDKNKELIQTYLKTIKPLSKINGDVPFDKVEKVIVILSKKYNVRIRDFVPDVWSNDEETIWRATLVDEKNLIMKQDIYGLSLYEVFAKTAIYMYSLREEFGERQVGN